MAGKKRTIVGYPLTPGILADLGALAAISPAPFTPAGNWTNVYRIWSCHGYRESGNEDRGTLKIQRLLSQSEDSFTLNVTQRMKNDRDLVHVLDAQVRCKNDTLATPIRWRAKSEFHDPNGVVIRDLGTEQRGNVRGSTVEIETNGKTRSFKCSHPLTGDWCLLEAIQRIEYSDSPVDRMDVLEEMALLQEDHQIVYDDQETFTLGGKPIDLYHFQQLGRGTLPYDYWLDRYHRLQIFVTLSIAYIRDENGERKTV